MFTPRRIGPTLVDALPHVRAKNLQPGDLIAHRGRPGFDEAGGRPVIRIDPSKTEGRVRRCLSCSGPGGRASAVQPRFLCQHRRLDAVGAAGTREDAADVGLDRA